MKNKFSFNKDILIVLNIYTIIVFSGWLIGVYHNYNKDTNYLQTQIYKDSNVIKFLLDRLSTFEEMVFSLNKELDEKEAYIAKLESETKLLKDLRSSKK